MLFFFYCFVRIRFEFQPKYTFFCVNKLDFYIFKIQFFFLGINWNSNISLKAHTFLHHFLCARARSHMPHSNQFIGHLLKCKTTRREKIKMWSICLTPLVWKKKTSKKLVIQSIWQLNFHLWFAFHFRILFDMQCCAKNHLFIYRIRVCVDSESFNTLIDKLNLNQRKRQRWRRRGKTVHIQNQQHHIEFGIVW